MRIDKLIANEGFGSRKEVKHLLKSGQVLVNGEAIKQAKMHVDPERDEITVMGQVIDYQEFIYLMMNKPPGVVSATEDHRDETVIDLIDPSFQVKEPFPVGRLDKDTEGLLILTNDGKLAHQLLSPKKNVGKTYFAEIEGVVVKEDIETFNKGVSLDDGYETKPAQLTILTTDATTSAIEVVISEGKYHQVKRMFEAVGKRVTYLKRMKMGSLSLDQQLELGEYRELTKEELEYLKGLHG